MKIQVCSDLHLEFASNRDWLKKNPLIPKGEILVIAGDTYYLERNLGKLDFINRVSDEFEQVYLIPGNHEYYGTYDVSTALHPMQREILKNVVLLNNSSIMIEETTLIFSTMWSKIERNRFSIMRRLMDFKRISYKNESFTLDQFNNLHDIAFEFIQKEVKKEGKKIVITHHLPSIECNVAEFKGSKLNDAFCVDKTEFILDSNIDFWVYGHSHRNKKDFRIGETKMVTNQFGYIDWKEHQSFNYQKVIEI